MEEENTEEGRIETADEAIKKHGSAVDAVLNEPFERWRVGQVMHLFAALARELAAAEKKRRDAAS